MKLYNVAYSGNSYKVRLLLAQLGISHEIIEIDILKGESRTAEFLKINPNGRTPALDDDGFILAESNAILAYLAKGTKFLPDERKNFAPARRFLFGRIEIPIDDRRLEIQRPDFPATIDEPHLSIIVLIQTPLTAIARRVFFDDILALDAQPKRVHRLDQAQLTAYQADLERR